MTSISIKSRIREAVGKEVFRENCTAAKLVADLFSTSLGPTGMAKVLLEDGGDFKITRDGEKVSKEVAVVHPVGRILMEAGLTTRAETGDGFISTVVLAGLLVEKGWNLAIEGVHPSVIATGYQLALNEALRLIERESRKVAGDDYSILVEIARTHLSTKMPISWAEHLAPLVVKAFLGTVSLIDGKMKANKELVKVECRRGASVEESQLIDGIVLHKKGVDRLMPKRISNAKIALVQEMMGIERPDMFTKIIISSSFQVQDFYRERWSILRGFIDPLLGVGANVVLCGGDIAEELRKSLANNGVLAVRNVAIQDMKLLKEATGGELVLRASELQRDSLGFCGSVEQRIVAAHDSWLFFENCRNKSIKSLLLRGSSDFVVEEVKRAVINCLKLLQHVLEGGGVVAGGGAIEYKIAQMLRKRSLAFGSRIHLTFEAFADALEELPLWLVRNTGGDPTSVRAILRKQTSNGLTSHIDAFKGLVSESTMNCVLDSTMSKIQCLKSATEAAVTILRVDRMIQQLPLPEKKKSPIPEPVRALRGWK